MLERNMKTLDGRGSGLQRLVVRLLSKTVAAQEECTRLRDRLIKFAAAEIDDTTEPLDTKIRIAQHNRIPFIVIVSGGEKPHEIVDVILWTGEERLMSIETLLDQVARWRKDPG